MFRQKDKRSIRKSTGKDVLLSKETSSLSLFMTTSMAKSTGILVKKETTSKDTNSHSASKVLPLIKSGNSREFFFDSQFIFPFHFRWCHQRKSSMKETRYSAKITPDEDTRPECRNVGSWTVTSLGYVHKFSETRVALYYDMPNIQ